MNIQQVDDNKHGIFKLFNGETVVGEMAYTCAGDIMLIIDHTDVNDQFRG